MSLRLLIPGQCPFGVRKYDDGIGRLFEAEKKKPKGQKNKGNDDMSYFIIIKSKVKNISTYFSDNIRCVNVTELYESSSNNVKQYFLLYTIHDAEDLLGLGLKKNDLRDLLVNGLKKIYNNHFTIQFLYHFGNIEEIDFSKTYSKKYNIDSFIVDLKSHSFLLKKQKVLNLKLEEDVIYEIPGKPREYN